MDDADRAFEGVVVTDGNTADNAQALRRYFAAALADEGVYAPQEATVIATGNTFPFPSLVSVPGVGVSIHGEFFRSSGVTILPLPQLPDGILTLELPNTKAVQGNLTPGSDGTGLTSFSAPLLELVSGSVRFSQDYADLATLNLSELRVIGGDFVTELPALINLDLSSLEHVGALTPSGGFSPGGSPLLAEMLLPSLVFAGLFGPSGAAVETLDISQLVAVASDFLPSGFGVLTELSAPALTTVGRTFDATQMALVETMNFPALQSVGGAFGFDTLPVLTSINFSALATIGGDLSCLGCDVLPSMPFHALTDVHGIIINSMPLLTSATFPVIVNIGANGIALNSGTDALATFTLGTTLKSVGGDVDLSSSALPEANVDALLVRLAALNGTSGTTTYDNHAVTITGTSAPPSAAGLTAKATLEGRGNTVTVNS